MEPMEKLALLKFAFFDRPDAGARFLTALGKRSLRHSQAATPEIADQLDKRTMDQIGYIMKRSPVPGQASKEVMTNLIDSIFGGGQ